MKDRVYRTYIKLARGENWSESEIGETKDFVGAYSGRLIGSYPLTQINWTENAELKAQVCEAWDMTEEEFEKRLIIEKPTLVQNLYFCSVWRRLFGNLGFVQGFDRDGNLLLPKEKGFLVPSFKGGKIDGLKFYRHSVLKRKAA